jgi:glycosyltransferase involved in cell wall biosynthesis
MRHDSAAVLATANRRIHFARGLARPRVSVVIPTLNEARNLPWVLSRLPVEVDEVVLVDGHSTDETVAVARAGHARMRIVAQPLRGKGAALIAGLHAATGDIVVMIDADGSMDPVEIPGLVGALLAGADVAKASRYVAGGGSDDLTPLRGFGNRVLTVVGRALFAQRWSELCYGYAAFWRDAIPALHLDELVPDLGSELKPEEELAAWTGEQPREGAMRYGHGFEIEAIIFTRSVRAGLRVTEVASWEHSRQHGASKLSTFRDGWRVLTALWRERFTSIPKVALDADLLTLALPHPTPTTENFERAHAG